MKSAIELIIENTADFPEFRYYIPLMKKAEKNLGNQPDICVETSKSLFEGVSKTIILRLDQEHDRADIDKMDVGKLVKKAMILLKAHDDVIEDNFVSRSVSLAYALATLRNERGDISHGKAVPKHKRSDVRLAYLSYQMAEGIVSYMLDSFFRISREQKEEERSRPQIIDLSDASDLEQVKYDDNEGFNESLDEGTYWDGKLRYSEALYDLYYEDYIIRLDGYRDSLEEEE